MDPVDILQWTMGWSWPIVAGLGILMTWGIVRFMDLAEEGRGGEQATGTETDRRCVCECRL